MMDSLLECRLDGMCLGSLRFTGVEHVERRGRQFDRLTARVFILAFFVMDENFLRRAAFD
ncbi:MAG: hypothetical protein MI923_07760 [Phycisphaerales bacterium]|nr:hypothetical protein [Phycisphaerales bacterium]